MTDYAAKLDKLAENYCIDFYDGGTYHPVGQILMDASAEIDRLNDVEKRYEYLRKLNVTDFQKLYVRCVKEDLRFDNFVLKLANEEAVL